MHCIISFALLFHFAEVDAGALGARGSVSSSSKTPQTLSESTLVLPRTPESAFHSDSIVMFDGSPVTIGELEVRGRVVVNQP